MKKYLIVNIPYPKYLGSELHIIETTPNKNNYVRIMTPIGEFKEYDWCTTEILEEALKGGQIICIK